MVFDGKSPGSILLATALAFASLVLSSCEQREQRVDRALRDGILLTANGSEPAELDPHIVSGDPENKVITSLLEGLIAYHPDDDYVAEPGVAESWEMEDSGRVWTFKLRKNAKWSNGDPLTAHDFHWSHMRGLSPELANEFATMLYIIEGAEAFNKGETDDFSTVGVEVIDDYTIRYRLTGPTPYFISMLKHYSFWPVHRPTIEKFGRLDERATGWTRPGNFVGNGPFILEEWKFKDHIKVRKNPHYWDADRVKLNGIHFFAVENVTTEERMFRNGQVHLTKECALNKIPFYREDYPDWIQIGPQLVTYYYLINVTRPELADPKVRKALSYAIDRDAIVNNITRAGERAAYGYVPAPPEGSTGYQPPDMLGFDPEKAKRLMAEAGFPDGEGFPEFEIIINTHEAHKKIAEAIQEMWKKHLNINVGIINQSWQVYLDTVRDLNYDIGRRGWIGDYMDPITFLYIMKDKDDPNNSTGWENKEFKRLLDESGQLENQEERYAKLQEAERVLLEDMPLIPIYWYVTKRLVHPDLKGFHPKLLDNHPYKYIYLERDPDYERIQGRKG